MTDPTALKQPTAMVPVTRHTVLELRRALEESKPNLDPLEFQARHAELVQLEYQRLVNHGMLECCPEADVMEMALAFANQSPV